MDESTGISDCQVTSKSQNPISNSNVSLNLHPPNPKKPTTLPPSNSNLIEKLEQRILELYPFITVFNSKNLIPNPMENNSPNNPSIHTYLTPQHLGCEENLPGKYKNSEKLKEKEFEILNGEFLNGYIDMELSPNVSEDSSGHTKTSLRSWKRLLGNSNPTSLSIDNKKPVFQTHIKRTSSRSSSVESQIHKKLATESFSGDTLPPCHPP